MELTVIRISGKRTSTQRALFLDMANNPDKYKGQIIYLTEIDNDEIISIFDNPKKFYFNESGTWYESDFIDP